MMELPNVRALLPPFPMPYTDKLHMLTQHSQHAVSSPSISVEPRTFSNYTSSGIGEPVKSITGYFRMYTWCTMFTALGNYTLALYSQLDSLVSIGGFMFGFDTGR
jgi:hypothetical protein